MIHLFETGRRILFFPRGWANSVTNWLLGVHSPDGTIKVNNTADPGKDRSVALDVDIEAVASKIEGIIREHGFSASQRMAIKDVIRCLLDGASLKWNGNSTFSVSKEWVESLVKTLVPEDQGAQQPSSTTNLESGFSGIMNDHTKHGGTFTAGAPGGAGIVVKMCCRGMDDGQNGTIFWRPFTITSDGRIYAIAAESDSMGMYTDQ